MIAVETSTARERLTIGDLSALLNEKRSAINYVIDTYRIEPVERVGITRVWSRDQLPTIQAALSRTSARRNS